MHFPLLWAILKLEPMPIQKYFRDLSSLSSKNLANTPKQEAFSKLIDTRLSIIKRTLASLNRHIANSSTNDGKEVYKNIIRGNFHGYDKYLLKRLDENRSIPLTLPIPWYKRAIYLFTHYYHLMKNPPTGNIVNEEYSSPSSINERLEVISTKLDDISKLVKKTEEEINKVAPKQINWNSIIDRYQGAKNFLHLSLDS